MLKYYFSSFTIFLSILSISQITLVHADWKDDMLKSVNAERAKVAGLKPMCYNKKLTAASENHADDMVANNFFSHTGSDGSQPWDRMDDVGYIWGAAAENIAVGQTSVKEVMTAWMNSPGHKANILGNTVHFGAAKKNNYWVQKFASPWGDSEVCDKPGKSTCGDVGNYFTLKNEFCKVRANKKGAKFPKYWEVSAGNNNEVLETECQKAECMKKDCCVKGRARKCSNTGKKGQKGIFTQKMCGDGKTLKPLDQLKTTACTGGKGYKCTKKNCCE